MGERYEMAIAKEKRLEAAQQPILSEAAKKKAKEQVLAKDSDNNLEEENKQQKKKSNKRKKKKIALNEDDLNNVDALKEVDEVEEGIDWSDSDSD